MYYVFTKATSEMIKLQTTVKNLEFTESSKEEIHRNMMCACAVCVCAGGLFVCKWEKSAE